MSDQKDLAVAITAIEKKYGRGCIAIASQAKALRSWPRIETGIFALDWLLGNGLPAGVATELYGAESAGKSTTANVIVAAAQRYCRECVTKMEPTGKMMNRCPACGWRSLKAKFCEQKVEDENGKKKDCATEMLADMTPELACPKCKKHLPYRTLWMDEETAFTNPWHVAMGGDCSLVVVHRAQTAEEAVDASMTLLGTGVIDFVVCDTLAQLVPRVELEDPLGKAQVAVQARLVNRALRGWLSLIADAGVLRDKRITMLWLNQVRYKIGGFGDPFTRPGGKGQDFQCAAMLKMWHGKIERDKLGNTLSSVFCAAVAKNRTSPTSKMESNWKMNLRPYTDEDGILRLPGDTEEEKVLFDYGMRFGVITQGKKGYEVGGKVAATQEEAREILRTDLAARKAVRDVLMTKMLGEVWYSLHELDKKRKRDLGGGE